jgi:tetratricopeptide (TPR) repeat protein
VGPRHRLCLLVLFGALAVLPAPAHADSATPTPAEQSEAKTLYEQGAAAYRNARYARAIEHFLAADALVPSAALSFNVAKAYEKLGDSAKALRYYRDFGRRAPGSQTNETRTAIAALEQRLMQRGVQQLSVFSEPDADLSIDGKWLGQTPWTGELGPGPHRLVLSRQGFAATTRNFVLPAEHALDLEIRLMPSASPMGPNEPSGPNPVVPAGALQRREPAKDTSRASTFGPWPWVTLAAGGVSLATAGAFELSRRSAEEDARQAGDQRAYADSLDAMHDRQTAARIFLGVGAALVTVGATLVIVDLGNDDDHRRVAVSCAPGACVGRLEVTLR